MKTNTPKRQTRTIRLTIPTSVYARLAFLAAQESMTVPQFVYVAVLGHIAQDGMVPLDLVPGMLAAKGVGEAPAEIKMPGDDNSGDAEQANDFGIEDLL